jgi:hypothetical protein
MIKSDRIKRKMEKKKNRQRIYIYIYKSEKSFFYNRMYITFCWINHTKENQRTKWGFLFSFFFFFGYTSTRTWADGTKSSIFHPSSCRVCLYFESHFDRAQVKSLLRQVDQIRALACCCCICFVLSAPSI